MFAAWTWREATWLGLVALDAVSTFTELAGRPDRPWPSAQRGQPRSPLSAERVERAFCSRTRSSWPASTELAWAARSSARRTRQANSSRRTPRNQAAPAGTVAQVKVVVPQAVFRNGASVLNAEDPWTVEMARTARGEIIFFAMDAENPVVRDHLRERGRAVVMQQTAAGEMLTVLDGKRETGVLQ